MKHSYILILALCAVGSFNSYQVKAFELAEFDAEQEAQNAQEEESGSNSSSSSADRRKASNPSSVPTAAKIRDSSAGEARRPVQAIGRAQSAENRKKSNTGIALDFPDLEPATPKKAVSSVPKKTISDSAEPEFSGENPLFKPQKKPALVETADAGFEGFDSSESTDPEEILSEPSIKPKQSSSRKYEQMLADKAKAQSSAGHSEEKALFVNVTPESKRSFTSQVEYTTKKLAIALESMPLSEAGPLCLKVLGMDHEEISPESLRLDSIENPITKVAITRRSLQLSLQHAKKYEDLSTPEALAKIDTTGSFSRIAKPADLAQINDTLARLSLPQITKDFSDEGNWISSSGSAKIKTLTSEAGKIISQIADTAEKYLRALAK